MTDAAITSLDLKQRLADSPPPSIVDVRSSEAFERDPHIVPGAQKHDSSATDQWGATLDPWRGVVVYCVRGHDVSQGAAAELRRLGLDARYLEGGLEGWRASGGATIPFRPPTRWVTRERPKIDRIACPWLVRRFIDPAAEFFYVPAREVRAFAETHDAEPYDVPDVRYTHAGAACSFDAFMRIHALAEPALDRLAAIVRAADTHALALASQAPGLLALSQGLSRMFGNDHAMLKWGCLVYDSLYAWCRETQAAATEGRPAQAA